VRIALGGAAPMPIRAGRAETGLRGTTWNNDALRAAAADTDPLSDVMGTARHCGEMVRVCTRRLRSDLREQKKHPR